MTAYNVVRFRVKPGMEDKFVASQRASLEGEMKGALDAALIKTGDRTYILKGKWNNIQDNVSAPPRMNG
jgi:hypothetical protein